MIRRYRRFWAIPAAVILALPLLVTVIAPATTSVSRQEARVLAPAPSWPASPAGWLALPRQIDAYLSDHFGLRQTLIFAYQRLMDQSLLRTGNDRVLVGPHGWMFFRGDAMITQSAGLLRRDAEVAQAADLLATIHAALASQGIQMLVAPPPNASTIYVKQLPLWAQNPGKRTEYDVLLDDLAARGIQAVDLRPALRLAAAQGKAYREHDTHWTARGALAAFNQIVREDSHPGWQLDPASALGPQEVDRGGDLARFLGVGENASEVDRPLALPDGKRDQLTPNPFGTFVETSGHPGSTIMIIGDSFTEHFLAPMLLPHVGRVIWLHHQLCGFDWQWINRLHPDEVWWMPTERYIVCLPGRWPAGLPRPGQPLEAQESVAGQMPQRQTSKGPTLPETGGPKD